VYLLSKPPIVEDKVGYQRWEIERWTEAWAKIADASVVVSPLELYWV
jgi:hypothetical protein